MANASNGASDAEDQAPRMSHRHSNASRQADSGTKAFVSAASNGTSTDDGSSGMHWQHQQQHGDLSSSNNDTASAAVTNANAVGTHSSDNNYDDNGTEPAAHGDEAAEQSSVGASSGAEQQDSDVASHESALEDQQDKRGSLQSWSDSSVLQFLHEHSAMSFAELGERLQVPQDFSPIGKVEEDSLVLAACRQHTMLSLFRAYAPHDVLMFISFARKCCWQS